MSYGAYFIADDGSLLVSSDQPCYEFVGEYFSSSRTSNVSTFNVPMTDYPLVFVNTGASGKGGLLAIEGNPGAWVVSVLSDGNYSINVFRVIGGAPSGYGLATFSANGSLCFDTSKKILNAKAVTTVGSGITRSTPVGTNSVSYTSGQVQANSSVSEEWVLAEEIISGYLDYVCEPTLVCGPDIFGNYWCTYETVCTPVFVTTITVIYGRVRTTNWRIDRGVASMNSGSGQVGFAWLRHKEGFYKQIVGYTADSISVGAGYILPGNYVAPPVFFINQETFEGELTKDNTFPYSQTFNNMVVLTCITATRSDYD
jgi:hypothetical protein